MALTKVSGHIIDQPFDVGIITATNSYVSGIGTFGNIRVLGDIQVDGTTTTLDTVVTEVDRLEVGANNSTVGVAITQSGSGDIFNLYDGSTEVFSVADGGTATFASRVNVGANNLNNRAVNAINASTTVGSVSANNHNANGILFQGYNASVDPNLASFVVQSNGSTGIGTHTPTAKLDIKGTLKVGTSGLANGGTNIYGQLIVDRTGVSGSNPWLSINASGSTVFYVNGGGSVVANGGVNATSFTAGTSGTGNGNSSIFGSLTVDRNGVSGSNTWFQVKNGTTPIIYANGQGKVGIGTDNPARKLEIFDTAATVLQLNSTNSGGTSLRIQNSGTDKMYMGLAGDFITGQGSNVTDSAIRASGSLLFASGGGTERLRITSDGKIGINQTNPGAKLHIVDTMQATANGHNQVLILGDDSGTDGECASIYMSAINASNRGIRIQAERQSSSNNHDLIFQVSGVSAIPTERLRITSDGKVRVPDNGKFTAGAGDDLQIWSDNTDQYIRGEQNQLLIRSNNLKLQSYLGENYIHAANNNAVSLYYDNSKKLETTTTGAKVTGALEVTQEYPTIRPILDLNFAATKTLDRRITFTRDSIGTFLGEDGLVKYASNNVPRFDHDPTTRESLGLLIEESRTNQVAYSNSGAGLDGAPYYGNWNASPYTDNFAVAPDGTTTAWKMTPTTPSSSRVRRISVTAGNTYTFSVWLKKDPSVSVSDGVWDYLGYLIAWSQNGSTVTSATTQVLVAGSSASQELTTEWRRFSVSYTAPANMTSMEFGLSNRNSGSGNPGYSVFVWGAQLEAGSFATSYIPTSGSTVTRAQDTPLITGTNFTDFYNQSEGTLVLSADIGYLATSNQAAVAFEDTSNVSATFIAMGYNTGGGGSGHVGAWYNSSGTTSAFASHNIGITINTEFKQAYAYKLNDFASVANGSTPIADTSGGLTSLIDRVRFGIYHYDGMTSGHIRQFKYYNKRLPNAQLQGLTQQ